MAQGDVVVYNQFKEDFGDAKHHLSSASVWVALINNASTSQSAATADPRWGAGGTTNLNTDQVSVGGNYADGGVSVSPADPWTRSVATCTFDLTDITWSQNAANPASAMWAVGYNNSNAAKEAIFSLDLGGLFDMTTGDLVVTWNASGVFTLA